MSLHLELLIGTGFNYYTEQNPLVKDGDSKEKKSEEGKSEHSDDREGKDEAEERRTKREELNDENLGGDTIFYPKIPAVVKINALIGIKNLPISIVVGLSAMSTIYNTPVDKDGKELEETRPVILMLAAMPRYYFTKNIFAQIGISGAATVYGGSMTIKDSFNIGLTGGAGLKFKYFRVAVDAHAKIIAPLGSKGSEIKNYGLTVTVGGGARMA